MKGLRVAQRHEPSEGQGGGLFAEQVVKRKGGLPASMYIYYNYPLPNL